MYVTLNPRHVSSISIGIFRRTKCIITASGIVTLCKRLYSIVKLLPSYRTLSATLPRSEPLPTTTTGHYTICCKKPQSCAPEYGQNFARNMLSWSWRSIKLLLLHLVGFHITLSTRLFRVSFSSAKNRSLICNHELIVKGLLGPWILYHYREFTKALLRAPRFPQSYDQLDFWSLWYDLKINYRTY